jgi:hypothetical protein
MLGFKVMWLWTDLLLFRTGTMMVLSSMVKKIMFL